ncbi:hypothetical protein BGW38_003535 [Lunasporangiospora selenospora]|uniref:tRNA-uridine aminocarboxypropyltransferase n=1 Tax=Lunasporangiospora selenospora TaxID=979761 RepID=A0A9P6FR16_9FUNG|nr:hypothetical protein BGW38_003535 [Lunasporangiospora selenospora]
MLQDPNCTPLLLYPSHGAADIHSIASTLLQPNNPSSQSSDDTPSQYRCQGCTHPDPIYPGEDGPSLIANVPSKFPYRLIIAFDGSWSHAKIMYRCNPRLQQLTTQIKLPNPPPAVYHQLKQEPKETYTSTAEAVGQAVALLGWPGPQTELESESQDVGIKVDRLGKTSVNYTPLLMKDITRPIEKIIDLQRPFAQEEQAALENQGE